MDKPSHFATLAANATRMSLDQALPVAELLTRLLEPYAHRIEVAGSIRRKKPDMIKDVELVIVPRLTCIAEEDLFGSTIAADRNLYLDFVTRLKRDGIFTDRPDKLGRPAFGPRYQRVIFHPDRAHGPFKSICSLGPIPVDLFCVLPPAQFGVQLLLRTGPAEYSHRLVTPADQGGKILPKDHRIEDGRIIRSFMPEGQIYLVDEPIDTPEEEDVYRVLGLPYLPPEERK